MQGRDEKSCNRPERSFKRDGVGAVKAISPAVGRYISVFLVVFLFSGCSTVNRVADFVGIVDTANAGNNDKHNGNGRSNGNGSRNGNGHIKKVAVFPFFNMSGEREAGNIVANTYVSELFNGGRYLVEEPGNVRQFLIQERVNSIGELELDRVAIFGKRLKVDAIILGSVEEFSGGGRFGVPVVEITARMVESSSGRIVWASQNKRRGDEYVIAFDIGLVRSPTSLANKVVDEMLDTMHW